MNVFEALGEGIAGITNSFQAPFNRYAEEEWQRRYQKQLARQQAAIETIAELERQRELSQQPIPEGQHAVVPEWGIAEQLKKYYAYGRAGLDPKAIAEAERERLATEAFERASQGITDPNQLANLANKLDISPYRQVGEVTYDRFTGNRSYTPKGEQEAERARLVTQAFEQASQGITDPSQLANLANKLDISPYRQVGDVTYDRFTGNRSYTPKGEQEAKKARLAAQAFEQASQGITDPSQLANLANKLDISPYRQVGDVTYDRFTGNRSYTPKGEQEARQSRIQADEDQLRLDSIEKLLNDPTIDKAQLGNLLNKLDISPYRQVGEVTYDRFTGNKSYTPKGKQEARQSRIQADEDQIRLDKIKELLNDPTIDPLIAADVAQDKSVFKREKVEIEGPDGKRRIGYATLTPSGRSVASALTDADTKQPLIIPPASGDSNTLKQAREMVTYGRAKDIPEALTILTSSLARSPAEAWTDLFNKNSQSKENGMTPEPGESLTKTLIDWMIGRQGQPFPVDVESIIRTTRMKDKERTELLSLVQQYNQGIEQQNMANQQSTPAPVMPAPAMPAPVMPAPPMPAPPMPAPVMPAPPMPAPAMPAQAEPGPMFDFGKFAETVMSHNNPQEIRAALAQQGMNVSEEAMGLYLVNALNAGADPGDIDFLAELLGLDLGLADGG